VNAQLNNQELSEGIRGRAMQLSQIIIHLTRGMRDISLSHVLRKVDLAAWIKD
jgi:hypothetical protein